MIAGIKKHIKPILIWTLLIALYAYWQLIPEVSIVNGTGQALKHVEIVIADDDKVYRNILPGDNKSFRYHPARADGAYQVRVILHDDRIIKQEARLIEAWNFGHKIIFEVLPDGSIRTDLSYSLF
ncbi:MAG: hypothetical protein VW874_00385 [Gammaproteobacteria bacterium]|jgi:hypothetical protein